MPARVAICLFEDVISDFNDSLLVSGSSLRKVEIRNKKNDAIAFLKISNNSIPEWFDIFNGFAEVDQNEILTSSSGAILLLKCKKRIFGCCFGNSVSNINKENIVRDFGLAIAFNRIPKKNYKGIETFTLSENPITNNRSASIPASQINFNLDTNLETITELTGKYFSNNGNILIKGKEFYSTPAPLSIDEILKLCKNLINEYDKTINNTDFKRLTAVSKVKTKGIIEHLDKMLCERINKNEQNVHLVDFQNYQEINSYSFSPNGEKYLDFTIEDFYNTLKKEKNISIGFLKSKKIHVFNNDNQEFETWSLYKCLFTEININIGGGHILFKGNWYGIEERYLKDLKNNIREYEIQSSHLNLPRWDREKNENDYNINAAKLINGQCWDRKLYINNDYSAGIEFCDLLLTDYVIHVKRLHSSSLNSHLLMQTYVSAELLKYDPLIKLWIKKISKEIFKKNIFLSGNKKIKSSNLKYLIVLMSGSDKKNLVDSLPFFSLITFNMIIKRINQLGFDVEICLV